MSILPTLRAIAVSIHAFRADERGATAIEYALVASGIAVTIAATVFSLGSYLKTAYYDKIAALF
jgi:pilus assembly protein Flp/PilA